MKGLQANIKELNAAAAFSAIYVQPELSALPFLLFLNLFPKMKECIIGIKCCVVPAC